MVGVALAYNEVYGGYNICGEPTQCYVESSAAHTFDYNTGQAGNTGNYIACSLLNHSGVDVVTHGYFTCVVTYYGGQYVWARVYNESSGTAWVSGGATTS